MTMPTLDYNRLTTLTLLAIARKMGVCDYRTIAGEQGTLGQLNQLDQARLDLNVLTLLATFNDVRIWAQNRAVSGKADWETEQDNDLFVNSAVLVSLATTNYALVSRTIAAGKRFQVSSISLSFLEGNFYCALDIGGVNVWRAVSLAGYPIREQFSPPIVVAAGEAVVMNVQRSSGAAGWAFGNIVGYEYDV